MALICPEAGTQRAKNWGHYCGGDETSDGSCGSLGSPKDLQLPRLAEARSQVEGIWGFL